MTLIDASPDFAKEEEFRYMPKGILLLEDYNVQQKLLQWNLNSSLRIKRFFIQKRSVLDPSYDIKVLNDFFADKGVQDQLEIQLGHNEVSSLMYRRARTTVVSCSFFDKLVDAKIVSKSGSIYRQQDEYYDGCAVNDMLRNMMVNSNSEAAELFTNSEQSEFIFQLFRAIVVGGSLCQAEDLLEPYIEMVKRLYKTLVSVRKNASDPRVTDITSRVYQVKSDGDKAAAKSSLFPCNSPYNTCFAIIDAKKRWLTIWHNTFQPFW